MALKTKSGFDLDVHVMNALDGLREAIEDAVDAALKTRDLEWAEAIWGLFDIDGQPFNDALNPRMPCPDDAEKYIVTLLGRHPADDRRPKKTRRHRGTE